MIFSDLGVNVNWTYFHEIQPYIHIFQGWPQKYAASISLHFSPLRGFLKSALHHGPGAEVKLSSWNQTVNLFPHQLQPLPGILYCDFSTEWTQHSWVIVHLTKTSTYCGMCSQMRSCIVHEINRISQVFIVLFCSSWTNVRQFCWGQLP